MSQDSQCSTSSLEIMSQETRELLQTLLNTDKNNEGDFIAKYHLNPYDIHMVDNNTQESLEINIDRMFTVPSTVQCKQEIDDFGDSQSCEVTQDRNGLTPTTVDTIPQQYCLVPPNTNFPGFYHFDVGFQEEKGQPVKSAPWTYSHQLHKLFVKMRSLVPIRFIFHSPPPAGSYIKCVVVYQQPEHFREVVERCMNHMTKQNDGHCAPKQLLRCENALTRYETCPITGRHTLSIPVRKFDAGVNYFEEVMQFMCFNSCPGGLNRRPINVIFSFENDGQVLGRKILDSRICACPGRDRGNEETAENKKRVSNSTPNPDTNPEQPAEGGVPSYQETPPPTPINNDTHSNDKDPMCHRLPQKRPASKITEGFELHTLGAYKRVKREEDEEFTIKVRGREKYELILKIKEGLDLMDMVPQSFLDSYRAGCPPCGPNWFLEKQAKENSERTCIQDSARELHVSNSPNSDSEGSPPSTFPLSQLSRTSSNTSSQGGNKNSEYSAVRFSLKRTVSLERKGLRRRETEANEK